MSRTIAVLLVAALAAPASAQPQMPGSIQIIDAKIDKDKLLWTYYQLRTVEKEITVEEVVNGKKVPVTRKIAVTEVVPVTTHVELKALKVTDAAGKAIAADKLAELLNEPTPVVMTQGPIAEKHRAMFKDKIVFVELPPPPQPKGGGPLPGVPVPPGVPVKI